MCWKYTLVQNTISGTNIQLCLSTKIKIDDISKEGLKNGFFWTKNWILSQCVQLSLKGPSCYHQNMLSCWTWHFLGRLRWTNPYLAVVAFTQKAITILRISITIQFDWEAMKMEIFITRSFYELQSSCLHIIKKVAIYGE